MVTLSGRPAYDSGMPTVNPAILSWARATAGLSPEEAVKKLAIKDARGVTALERLDALENGRDSPSRAMLVKMAKQYRRPLLTFYLPDIPRKGDRGEDFRTLPDSVGEAEAGVVDAVVRDIRARQALVRAALEAADEAQPLPFIGSMDIRQGVAAVVDSIQKTLAFDLKQFRSESRPQSAFAYLRARTEAVGIFVLLIDNLGSWRTTIDVKVFRGFALADDVAPFVAVNANDTSGAWCFTLVHELAHLWIGATGVSGGTAGRTIEKFCNDVASELLLPRIELQSLAVTGATPFYEAEAKISEFAAQRNVSSTMVAYKLYRSGAYPFERFQQLEAAYRKAYLQWKAYEKERNAEREGGPTYHVVRQHRVGKSLIRFVERMMHEGNLSTTKAGKVLGVGAHNVYALIEQSYPNRAA